MVLWIQEMSFSWTCFMDLLHLLVSALLEAPMHVIRQMIMQTL